jgi:hypothetical protein
VVIGIENYERKDRDSFWLIAGFFSPDSNEKPGVKKTNFSCPKRATQGSSF